MVQTISEWDYEKNWRKLFAYKPELPYTDNKNE